MFMRWEPGPGFVTIAPMPQPVRVGVIEDDPVLRDSLRLLVEHPPDSTWVGGWCSGSDALPGIARAAPDVVLLDVNLGSESGIDCIGKLRETVPSAQIMMLTVYEDTESIFRALSEGAAGYLSKRTSGPRLLQAIAELHAGESPMSGHIARKLVESLAGGPAPRSTTVPAATTTTGANTSLSQLTQRENDVLRCLAGGCLYKEVADQLGMTIHTVRTHIRSIYEKLHVRSRTEAVLKFLGPPR